MAESHYCSHLLFNSLVEDKKVFDLTNLQNSMSFELEFIIFLIFPGMAAMPVYKSKLLNVYLCVFLFFYMYDTSLVLHQQNVNL